jgi:hypothetical protein
MKNLRRNPRVFAPVKRRLATGEGVDRIDSKTALSAYVRARLLREEREGGRGYRTLVAAKTGISAAHISNIMNREYMGVGFDAADGFAKLWGMSGSGELVATAKEWAKTELAATPTSPKLPNLDAAIDFVRKHGPLPDEVVEQARQIGQGGRDFTPATWIIILGELAQGHTPAPPETRKKSAPRSRS